MRYRLSPSLQSKEFYWLFIFILFSCIAVKVVHDQQELKCEQLNVDLCKLNEWGIKWYNKYKVTIKEMLVLDLSTKATYGYIFYNNCLVASAQRKHMIINHQP